ncbi:MAG: six-cysteine peptide SCIFF [Clostridiales bacterium]|nr:six-cysteine peptide SCIFF [Clostridiales bacterium]
MVPITILAETTLGGGLMKLKTIKTRDLVRSLENGGCGECQTSCQSACKTSCGVANQPCENKNDK